MIKVQTEAMQRNITWRLRCSLENAPTPGGRSIGPAEYLLRCVWRFFPHLFTNFIFPHSLEFRSAAMDFQDSGIGKVEIIKSKPPPPKCGYPGTYLFYKV